MMYLLDSLDDLSRIAMRSDPPFAHVVGVPAPAPIPSYNWPFADAPKLEVRRCVSRRCRDARAFMNEVAAALQFPDHFGHNGAALRDCLSDLSWFRDVPHLVALVRDADTFLIDEPTSEARSLVTVLCEQAATMPNPELAGWPASSMPARTMHWFFVCEPDRAPALAERLGAELLLMPTTPSPA